MAFDAQIATLSRKNVASWGSSETGIGYQGCYQLSNPSGHIYEDGQNPEAGMMRDLPESVGSHSGGPVPTRAM